MKNTFYLTLSLLFSACSYNTNEIYFNLPNNTIVRCEGKYIEDIDISSKENKQYYTFRLKDKSKATNSLSLDEGFKGYQLFIGGIEAETSEFSLLSNSIYIVSHGTEGHRPSSKITIKTGSDGEIIEASKTECK